MGHCLNGKIQEETCPEMDDIIVRLDEENVQMDIILLSIQQFIDSLKMNLCQEILVDIESKLDLLAKSVKQTSKLINILSIDKHFNYEDNVCSYIHQTILDIKKIASMNNLTSTFDVG